MTRSVSSHGTLVSVVLVVSVGYTCVSGGLMTRSVSSHGTYGAESEPGYPIYCTCTGAAVSAKISLVLNILYIY